MSQKRIYTHCIITYASEKEFSKLLQSAQQWAWIKHDRDEVDPHYHILACFRPPKSINAVRKLVQSNQNTLSQELNGTVDDMLTYFTHEEESGKELYSAEEIHYSDVSYWQKRREQDCADEFEQNETFLQALMSDEFSLYKMAYQYGKDFIRYHEQYLKFRQMLIQERNDEYESNITNGHQTKSNEDDG